MGPTPELDRLWTLTMPQQFEPLLAAVSVPPAALCRRFGSCRIGMGNGACSSRSGGSRGLEGEPTGLATSVTLGLGFGVGCRAPIVLQRWWDAAACHAGEAEVGQSGWLGPRPQPCWRRWPTGPCAAIRERHGVANVELQVDANGGWSEEQARRIHGQRPFRHISVVLLEQPLAPHPDPGSQDTAGFAALKPTLSDAPGGG